MKHRVIEVAVVCNSDVNFWDMCDNYFGRISGEFHSEFKGFVLGSPLRRRIFVTDEILYYIHRVDSDRECLCNFQGTKVPDQGYFGMEIVGCSAISFFLFQDDIVLDGKKLNWLMLKQRDLEWYV